MVQLGAGRAARPVVLKKPPWSHPGEVRGPERNRYQRRKLMGLGHPPSRMSSVTDTGRSIW